MAPPAYSSSPPLPQCPDFKELCVQADRTGRIDLKTGVAHLEGNVVGVLKSRKITFRSQSLTAFRDGKQTWTRLVLDGEVHVEQARVTLDADQVVIESEPQRMTAKGKPVTLVLKGALFPANEAAPAPPPAGAAPRDEVAPAVPAAGAAPQDEAAEPTTTVHAEKAVIEEQERRLSLSGKVHLEQSDQGVEMTADNAGLFFDAEGRLDNFRAEGSVVITQPGRVVSANLAQSRNHLQTILLTGDARMRQAGQFDLRSERMEVYAQSSRGVVQSADQQKPITLSLDLAGSKPYLLSEAGLIRLGEGGLPPTTVQKLAPLVGVRFTKREAFSEAVRSVLTPTESTQYLDKIIDQAR